MKKSVALNILVLMLCTSVYSQLRIIEHGVIGEVNGENVQIEPGGTVDFSGTIQTWDVTLPILDFVVDYWVVNESETETYDVVCRRIETEVLPGSRNNTCWRWCPIVPKIAGEEPDWLVNSGNDPFFETIGPGDTITSFAQHYYPENLDGCSQFEFRFVDMNDVDITYASFSLEFRHGCQIGIDELNKVGELALYPNPSNEMVKLDLTSVNEKVNISVSNTLGEIVKSYSQINGGIFFEMETLDLKNGMYLINV